MSIVPDSRQGESMRPIRNDTCPPHSMNRRDLARTVAALGVAGPGLHLTDAVGQEGTAPASPVASLTPGTRSITREQFEREVREIFPVEEPAATGGSIIEVSTTDVRTLHPHLATDVYSQTITQYLFETLVTQSPIDGTPAPGLADFWELAEDGVTYTFHLNPDAVWHDGTPLTADDVVFSFDAVLSEKSLSTSRSTVLQMLGDYRKVDDHTVEMVSIGPLATFIEHTSMLVRIVPKHIWESVELPEWGSDPGATGQDSSRVIGSGPFRFVEWLQGDHVRLARNDDYWDSQRLPVLDEFIYQIFPDQASALAAFQTGAAELAGIAFFQVKSLRESNPELKLEVYDTLRSNYYYCNQDPDRSPLFVDARVRQAMMSALDRDLIAETVYQGFATAAIGTQPPLSIAYRPDEITMLYEFDPEKAAALMDEAGWMAGDDGIRKKDGVRFSFETMYNDASETFEQQIPYMQQAWREIGIEMKPHSRPFATVIDSVIAGDFEMALSTFGWDVDGGQGVMFRCDATPPDGFNRMRYCNPHYDELDELQLRELDVEKRIALLTEQTNIVTDDAAAGILVWQQRISGYSPRVHNYFPNGFNGGWLMPWVWMEQ